MAPSDKPTKNPEKATAAPQKGQEDTEVAAGLPPTLDSFLQALANKAVANNYVAGNKKGAVIKAIADYYSANADYPSKAFRALVGHTYQEDLVTSAQGNALSDLAGHRDALTALANATTPEQVKEAMKGFKKILDAYQLEVVKMMDMKKEETRLIDLKTGYSEMIDSDYVSDETQAKIKAITDEMDTYLEGVVFTLDRHTQIETDLQAKFTDFTSKLTPIFDTYKAGKIGELKGRKASDEQITALKALTTPKEFLDKLVDITTDLDTAEATVAAPETAATPVESFTTLRNEYTVLSNNDNVPASTQGSVTTVLGEIDTYVGTNPTDQAEMSTKLTAWKGQLESIFNTYKNTKIAELQLDEGKTAELNAITSPQKFLTALPTTGMNPFDLGNIADYFAKDMKKTGSLGQTLLNMQSFPLVGIVFKFIVDYLRENHPGFFGELKDSDTSETFVDLITGDIKNKTYEATDTAWKSYRQTKLQATYWLEQQLRVDGQAVGPKRDITKALFNSDFSIADLKTLAAKGQNPDVIEEEDLPPDFMDDLDIFRAVYNKVKTKLGTNTDRDTEPLAKFVAKELYTEPATSVAAPPDSTR